MFSIRVANTSDAPRLHQITTSLAAPLLQYPEQPVPPWLSQSLSCDEFVTRILSYQYQHFVMKNEQGEVMAFIAIKTDIQNNMHLYHLFVDECAQGKGLATALWQHVSTHFSIQQCTVRSSKNAVGFYKTLGFEPSGDQGLQTMNGVVFQAMALTQ